MPSITLNVPAGLVAGQAFTLNGTLGGYTTAPTLLYADGATLAVPAVAGVKATATANSVTVTYAAATPTITAATWLPLPAGATVSATAFSFTHPGLAAGTHAVAVADNANHTISGFVEVKVTAAPSFVESAQGATVELPKTITGSDGTKWSLTDLGVVTANGVPDATTYNAVSLFYDRTDHRVYHKNTSGQWWYKVKPTDKTWTFGTAPTGAK